MTDVAFSARLMLMVFVSVMLVGCRSEAVGTEPDECGNGVCDSSEGYDTCPEDCPSVSMDLYYSWSYVDLDTGEVETRLNVFDPPSLQGWDVVFEGAVWPWSMAVVNEDAGVEVAFIFHTPFEDVDRSFIEDADWFGNSNVEFYNDDVLLVRTDRSATYKVWLDSDHHDQVQAVWAPLGPI